MLSALYVHFLPALTTPEALRDGIVVVLDILRASTTTITTALVNGASKVLPFQEVAEAEAAAKGYPRESVILGGERGGLPIPVSTAATHHASTHLSAWRASGSSLRRPTGRWR